MYTVKEMSFSHTFTVFFYLCNTDIQLYSVHTPCNLCITYVTFSVIDVFMGVV